MANQRMRAWRKRNPERSAQLRREWYRRAKLRTLVAYSQDPPTCTCCGEATLGFLTIDHIDGGGNAHRRELGGGSSLLIWLQKQGYPAGFQVLCFNCNAGRYWNGGDCPHLGSDIVNNPNLLPACVRECLYCPATERYLPLDEKVPDGVGVCCYGCIGDLA